MTAPAFGGAGAGNSGTAAVTYDYPGPFSGGELLIIFIEDANEGVTPTPTPSGWTIVPGTPVGTGTAASTTATAIRAYYKFAALGDTATFTLGDLGDHQVGQMLMFSGVDPTTPFDATAVTGTAATSTAVTFPSITTATNNALVICAVANMFDSDTGQGSGFAHAGLSGIGSGNFNTSSGNGGGISYLYGAAATAGATGTGSCTLANTSVQGLLTIALRPNQQTVETLTKMNAFAVMGGFDDKATLTKLGGFAVMGGFDDKATLTKLGGFAVMGGFADQVTLTKLNAYAVIDATAPTVTARPQIFVIT